jgi:hypothetical protein
MKTLKSLGFTTLLLSLIACGGNTTKEKETMEEGTSQEASSEKKELTGMHQVDLSSYNLNASIYVPDDSKGKTAISTSSWGSIEITNGNTFALEIVPFGMTVAEKKEELAGDLVYTIEYLTESDQVIVYKKSIKDSETEAEYHFFMNAEVDGEIVEIKNSMEGSFSERNIERMLEAARSLTPNMVS